MIPEHRLQRRDSKKYITIEVRHSDTLASLRDEGNTFVSNTSTMSTRTGLLESRHSHRNGPPKTRRIQREDSFNASTIVEKSPVESYTQPQAVPEEPTVIEIPFEGRPVLELEKDDDITIKMLKTLHAQLERELQEKKERNERKKRMKKILKEEKEKERRASHNHHSSRRRGSGDTEHYSREQEIKDLQLIQEKLEEQKLIEQEIAEQIRRDHSNREHSMHDNRRNVVPVRELSFDSKKADQYRERFVDESKGKRFSSDLKRAPTSRVASKPPSRRLSRDELEHVNRKMSRVSLELSRVPEVFDSIIEFTRQEYMPLKEDITVRTFASDVYSSLEPKPFCSAVDSVKLAKGEYISSEEDDTCAVTFISEGDSTLFSDKEPLVCPVEKDHKARHSSQQQRKIDWECRHAPPTFHSHGVPGTPNPSIANFDQTPALPNRAASFDDSFSLFSFESQQR